MSKNSIYILLFCFFITANLSCRKDILTSTDYGLHAPLEIDLINRALKIDGQLKDGIMPASKGTGNVSISQYPTAVQVSAGVILYIAYNTSNDSNMCKLYIQIDSANSYWEARIKHQSTTSNVGLYAEVFIPNFVRNGNFNLVYSVEDCNGNVSAPVSTNTMITPPSACGASITGSVGITVAHFTLGSKAGIVNINYEMYSYADRIDVKYKGQWIRSTAPVLLSSSAFGPPGQSPNQILPYQDLAAGFVSGAGIISFAYDGEDENLFLYVTGGGASTRWDVTVNCPQ